MINSNAQIIQRPPLIQDKCALTTGKFPVKETIYCAVAGGGILTFPTGKTQVITFAVGDYFAFTGSFQITTGTYHLN